MTPIKRRFAQENRDLIGIVKPIYFIYYCNISLKYQYVYYATPKVACSTTLLTLQRAEIEDPYYFPLEFEDIHEKELSPLLTPTQIGSLSRLLASPYYCKFCFVRNPFTRILSCYLDKVAGGHPHKRVVLNLLGRPQEDLSQPVTFEEFVDVIAAQPISEMHDHWFIQWYHLGEGRFPFDIIGRFETFSSDFEEILRRIGIDATTYYAQEMRNVTNAGFLLEQYYDKRLVEIVRRVYALDFEHFGYPLDLPI